MNVFLTKKHEDLDTNIKVKPKGISLSLEDFNLKFLKNISNITIE